MLKYLPSNRCTIHISNNPPVNNWYLVIYVILFSFSVSITHVLAEGSKELNSNGGNRAYLLSSTTFNASYPFPTLGTMKVYVKAGESIYVGSSVQGINTGTINFRSPDGSTYTSGTDANTGLIRSRDQEVAGPLPNTGGYTPFIKTVQVGQEGVWEIDFIPEGNGTQLTGNPIPVASNASWIQPTAQYIAAFDVSVRDAANTRFLTGRVFTNVFSGVLGAFNVGFNGIFNILTKDGYQYTLNNNGQAGNGFTFFVNNKGFRDANGGVSYKSVNLITTNVQDPRSADTQSDVTQKIFFNPPATDLPASANTPGGGTTWLLNAPVLPTISNVTFTGIEGTVGKAGTTPLGGYFIFNTSGNGNYVLVIDANQNGLFTDVVDRKLTGAVNTGTNLVYWDGLDGEGKKVPPNGLAAYNANITIMTTAGEVHFPFFDVERNVNGLKLSRTNGIYAPDDTLFWDDSPVAVVGTPSNPVKNLTGISSTANGHKWGTATADPNNDADFGNNKSIDTWGYIASAPISSSVSFQLQEADLAVSDIIATAGCAGLPVTYQFTVKNNGPSAVTGAKLIFNYPADVTGLMVNSMATSGVSAVSTGLTTATSYTCGVDLANGAVRTFHITGNVNLSSSGNLSVSAGILRPADVTDPDATNPDATPPADPLIECDASPSGAGCNNVKTNTVVVIAAPNAGPDQTIFQYASATLSAAGTGIWTQAPTDAHLAAITSPASSSTVVTGLNNLGLYHFVYTNTNGCTDTAIVKVIAADLEIPNIITPNNDGKNDTFKITGLESYAGSQLIIFNRWGNEVYRSDNYLNNWDGSGLAEATYYYILNRKDHDGAVVTIKGWVFLKRNK